MALGSFQVIELLVPRNVDHHRQNAIGDTNRILDTCEMKHATCIQSSEADTNCVEHRQKSTLLAEVVIKTLECVTDERQAHLGRLFDGLASSKRLGLEHRGVVRLVDFVRGEVCRIDARRQARLERSTDAAQALKFDASEEGVCLDVLSSVAAQTSFRVANQTGAS